MAKKRRKPIADWVNLDVACAKFIVPRLRELAAKHSSYPPELTPAKWRKILLQMADGFAEVGRDDYYLGAVDERDKKINAALDLFREWFRFLWD